MGYRVRFKHEALGQIDALYAYISERDHDSAESVIARLHALFAHLGEFPNFGKVTDEDVVHRFPVGKTGMVVFYTLNDPHVTIIRVIHSRHLKK